MSLELLEKLAVESNNAEIINAVGSVKESYRTNVERLSFLEKDIKKAVEKRDEQSQLVKNKLGIKELSEEALEEALSKLKGNSSNDGEIKNLTTMVEMLKTEKEAIEASYKSKINSYKIERALSDLGAREEAEGKKAYDIILNEISDGIEFDENGNIVFKAKDGTTVRNTDGSPISLADKYNQLKDSDELSFLFKKKRSKSGTGSGGAGSGARVTSLNELDEAQRVALFKQDPEQYRRLAGLS